MRKTHWLRYGLGSLVATGAILGGFLVACGDDDDATGATPTPDGGGGSDVSQPDTGPGADSGPAIPNAKITVVNAGTDFGPSADLAGNNAVRICFGISPDGTTFGVTGIPPQPESSNTGKPPGIYLGTGGALPSYGVDLSTVALKPYLMNAKTMYGRGIYKGGSNAAVCDQLVGAKADAGAGALVANVDYWELPPITKGTFAKGKSYVLALTGCTQDTTIGADADQKKAKCGSDFDGATSTPGAGNLKARIYEVDRATAVEGSKFGAQFIHAATATDAVLAQAAGGGRLDVMPGIAQPDGGAYKALSTAAVPLYNTGGTTTPLVQLEGVSVTGDVLAPSPGVFGTDLAGMAIPLPLIQALSFVDPPATDAQKYKNGAGWVFIAVGDATASPDAGAGQFNTRTFHYLGFPTDPVIERYTP